MLTGTRLGYVAVFLIALVVVGRLSISSVMAAPMAAPQDYSYTYNVTNVYTNHVLSYSVSGLDTATQYEFTFQMTDVNGLVTSEIGSDILGPGIASGTFGTDFSGFEDSYGPLRVVDNFGQTLGKHFVAPAYLDSWQGNAGVTDAENKQGIGGVPYVELNPDYHHPFTDHGEVLTQYGEYTLLHFRTATTTDRFIKLFDISTHLEVAEFSVEELYDYNREITGSYSPTFEGLSFVVLNTAGTTLNFINAAQDAAAFGGSYDNPHELSIGPGIYEYARYNGVGTLISFGESVWIVSRTTDGLEWFLQIKNLSAIDGGQQCARMYQRTPEVWAGYSDQLLEDSSVGVLDATDYAYDDYRNQCYSAGAFASTPATVTWSWQALSMVEASIDEADFRFEIEESYDIIETGTFDAVETISTGLENFGLDTPFGNIVVMVAGMIGIMWITKNPFVALIGFLAIGGLLILLGFSTNLTKIIFAGSAVLGVVLYFRGMTNNRREEMV